MGIANIMKAKLIILVASGKNKADAIEKTVRGKVSEEVPASILQRHDNVILICDKEAASSIL